MEDHEFCDSCSGCRPALMTMTGEAIPDNHPIMIKVNDFWENKTSYAQRRAFIEVTLKNSRNDHDINLCNQIMEGIQLILKDS